MLENVFEPWSACDGERGRNTGAWPTRAFSTARPGAYSATNGVPACGDRELLTDTLRGEWGSCAGCFAIGFASSAPPMARSQQAEANHGLTAHAVSGSQRSRGYGHESDATVFWGVPAGLQFTLCLLFSSWVGERHDALPPANLPRFEGYVISDQDALIKGTCARATPAVCPVRPHAW